MLSQKSKQTIVQHVCRNTDARWKTNEDGSYDIDGTADFQGMKFDELPFKLNHITGNLDMQNIGLKNFKNFPERVGGYLDVSNNKIKSLEGSPRIINGFFSITGNKLKNFIGCPEESTKGTIYFTDNLINSCEGFKMKWTREFHAHENVISNTTIHILTWEMLEGISYVNAVIRNLKDPAILKDLEKMDLPENFTQKYRGNIAASNLGLI